MLLRSRPLLKRAISLSYVTSITMLLPVFVVTPLPRRHLRVALVDSSWPTTLDAQGQVCRQAEQQCAEPASGRDRRVYAISPASRQLLQAVGAWQLLPADGVHNYDAMQVCFPLNAAARDCDGPLLRVTVTGRRCGRRSALAFCS